MTFIGWQITMEIVQSKHIIVNWINIGKFKEGLSAKFEEEIEFYYLEDVCVCVCCKNVHSKANSSSRHTDPVMGGRKVKCS